MSTPTVRLKVPAGASHRYRPPMAAFIRLHPETEEVRVRFVPRTTKALRWKCDACGPHTSATCDHERAALNAWRTAAQTTPRKAHR